MVRLTRKGSKAGLPPGTLLHVGEKKAEEAEITVIDYNIEQFQEKTVDTLEECCQFRDKPTVTWINVDGLHDIQLLEKLGEYFGLHPLVLEDIVTTDQRPKLEDLSDYLFIVLRMLRYDGTKNDIRSEQVSLVVGPSFVISFQEERGDVFEPVRERIRKGKSGIRSKGADYLAYALVDAIVDSYFIILEQIGEDIEYIEEELVTNPTPETLQIIHELKRAMIVLRKSVWPLREIINGLERGEVSLIRESTRIYLRDVYDHTIQVIETIETYRDMISGMLDIYLSSISNRMNEIMKVLTIIATIFIPLTFITGIYGMNFDPESSPYNMPELNWYWGYPVVWVFMIGLGFLMFFYFRKRRWL